MNNKVIKLKNEMALTIPPLKTQENILLMYILYRLNGEIVAINKDINYDGEYLVPLNDGNYLLQLPLSVFKKYFSTNLTKRQMINYIKKLNDISVVLNFIDEQGKHIISSRHLFDVIDYYTDDDIVRFYISNAVYQNIGIIEKQFTLLALDEINSLKTIMGRKLYILFRVNEGFNIIYMSKPEFDNYFRFQNVATKNQNNLIQRGIDDLKKHLGIAVKVAKIKRGNKITQVNLSCTGLNKLYK